MYVEVREGVFASIRDITLSLGMLISACANAHMDYLFTYTCIDSSHIALIKVM